MLLRTSFAREASWSFTTDFEKVTLWGKDGVEFFHQLFQPNTGCVVMFISKEYISQRVAWDHRTPGDP